MLQHLIVARHGDYDHRDQLSEHGKQQTVALLEAIRPGIEGLDVTVLSSSADRAVQTAAILAAPWQKEVQTDHAFWDDDCHSGNVPRCLELIDGCSTPVVIVVTHLDMTHDISAQFGLQKLQKTLNVWAIPKGKAWYIDLATKEVKRIP